MIMRVNVALATLILSGGSSSALVLRAPVHRARKSAAVQMRPAQHPPAVNLRLSEAAAGNSYDATRCRLERSVEARQRTCLRHGRSPVQGYRRASPSLSGVELRRLPGPGTRRWRYCDPSSPNLPLQVSHTAWARRSRRSTLTHVKKRPIACEPALPSPLSLQQPPVATRRLTRKPLNRGRVLRSTIAGLVSHGPQLHYWRSRLVTSGQRRRLLLLVRIPHANSDWGKRAC